ncbi:MAG: ABC transporter permease subunit [Verrucomicrobiota bacterium]
MFFLAGAVLLAGWSTVHHRLPEHLQFLLPAPGAVWAAAGREASVLARATFNTVEGALLGFGLAIGFGGVAALVLSLSPLVRAGLSPYLMMLQLTPIPVLAPVLVLWAGPGLPSVILITFLVCFFPLVVNTTQGLISTDRQHVELFRMWRASRWQELWRLRVPAALPYFFTGLRIAAILAPIGAVIGDFSAGSSAGDGGGLGFRALIYSGNAMYPELFAVVALTGGLGFAAMGVVVLLSKLALGRWHDSYAHPDG